MLPLPGVVMTVTGARVLGDRYELGGLLGSGGMADVFRATDRVLARTVAIKMLRSSSANDSDRARFTAEARTLAGLNHPGLVTLLDAGITDEHPYLVMELVEGPSLSEAIRDVGPMDPVRVASLGAQVADALAYAHQNGVVHRDVKPGNILLGDEDRALLSDFGIARLLADDEHNTGTGETIGSPAYLSPEQVNGIPPTEAVDVYSLGLVLLEAITATRAYPGTPVEAAVARLSAAPAIPTSLDAGWRDLLMQMTQRDPADRPTALEVATTLNSRFGAVSRIEPVVDSDADAAATLVHPAGHAYIPVGTRRLRTAWLVAVGLLVVLVLIGGAVALLRDPSPGTPAQEVPARVPDRTPQPRPTATPTTPSAPTSAPSGKSGTTDPRSARPGSGQGKHKGKGNGPK